MNDTTANNPQSPIPPLDASPAPLPASNKSQESQDRMAQISTLLSSLEDAATESGLKQSLNKSAIQPKTPNPAAKLEQPQEKSCEAEQSEVKKSSKVEEPELRLVKSRLKIASGLWTALRHKHAPSAMHSLRVALGCSSWAMFAGLDEESRAVLEQAALLHDIGKIGVPDSILHKASRLSSEEKSIIGRQREIALDILLDCCGSEKLLKAVRHSGDRFDGLDGQIKGQQIPLEARMIAIVDAFDAMTTDHVYRPAKSRERAFNELFEYAGTQFDPQLVKEFVQSLSDRQDSLTTQIAADWLKELSEDQGDLPWAYPDGKSAKKTTSSGLSSPSKTSIYEQKLVDAMHDGVVFVDAQAKIIMWSKGAERITGVSGGAADGRVLSPTLLDMCDHLSRKVNDKDCPVAKSLITNTQLRKRLLIMGRQGQHVAVDLHAIPVHAPNGTVQGATVILHDAQPEASLEEKCSALHAEVTRDPLTKVANRAEFDRMLALFVEAHKQASQPCSLIMVDIDRFKSINDTFGHQAGDEAIITLANLLSSMCRTGDLVARYGGEEFAVLCADCTNADGARRAEQMRRKLSEIPQPTLGNKFITASFGVTELQAGDTPETMLRRSDRALLMAKEQGRNQVIQLGNGMEKEQPKKKWWQWGSLRAKPVIENTLTSAVPIDIAIEKLRGFVSDHQAKIISTKENTVELEVSTEKIAHDRRKGDRHILFRVELQFSEQRVERSNSSGFASGSYVHTQVKLEIRPKRSQKRRRADMAERANLLQQSIKSYLMAKDGEEMKAEFTLVGSAEAE